MSRYEKTIFNRNGENQRRYALLDGKITSNWRWSFICFFYWGLGHTDISWSISGRGRIWFTRVVFP